MQAGLLPFSIHLLLSKSEVILSWGNYQNPLHLRQTKEHYYLLWLIEGPLMLQCTRMQCIEYEHKGRFWRSAKDMLLKDQLWMFARGMAPLMAGQAFLVLGLEFAGALPRYIRRKMLRMGSDSNFWTDSKVKVL